MHHCLFLLSAWIFLISLGIAEKLMFSSCPLCVVLFEVDCKLGYYEMCPSFPLSTLLAIVDDALECVYKLTRSA